MVFESVVVEFLNRYLKPYVKKLDTSQLKVGVWKGHASLDKLELKEDIFAEAGVNIPLKVKRSHIGKLDLNIPWKRLTKDPLVIVIDEVYVVLGLDIDTKYDKEKDLVRIRKEKEKKIEDFMEALKKKKKAEKESKKAKKKKEKDDEKPDSFIERLAIHLTKNLQVLVRDIHVRYEDSLTKPGTTMAAGATLHSLEVKSTDSEWMPTVVRETATVIYKLLELNSLGVYWNPCDQSICSLETSTMIDDMRMSIARPAMAPPPSNAYLLSPVSATAKLKMNVKLGRDLSMPQLVGGVDCGDIMLSLQQEQLKALLMTIEYLERYKVNQKYLKYRPSLPLMEDKRGWWRYAITAVLEEDVKRRTRMWSWKHMKEHRDLCVRYQMKYREKVHGHSNSLASKEELQKLEDNMDWINIMVYRKAALSKLKKPKSLKGSIGTSKSSSGEQISSSSSSDSQRRSVFSAGSKEAKREEKARKEEKKIAKKEEEKAAKKAKKETTRKEKKSSDNFFSKFKSKLKGSSKGKGEKVEATTAAHDKEGGEASEGVFEVISEEIETAADTVVEGVEDEIDKAREQLYKDIGYVENEELNYPKEYVGHEIHVNVNSLDIELLGKKKKIGNLVTEKIAVHVYHRPATNAVSLSTSVGSLVMTGIPLDGRQTTLVTSVVGNVKDPESHLVDLQLEISPIDRPDRDFMVKGSLRPIQIIYDFETVNALIEMFKPPKLIHFHELTQAASSSWEELKSQTSSSIKNALQDRKQIEIDFTLHSPYLVIPEKGQFKDNSNMIVVDLGKLSVFGCTTDNKSATINTHTDDIEKFYDTFAVKLDGMQVLVSEPGEEWKTAMSKLGSTSLHIMDPTGFEISLLKSIIGNSAYLPGLVVEGVIPGFEVKISDNQLACIMKVVSSLEKPPALITVTDAYDSLPSQPVNKLAYDSVTEVAQYGVLYGSVSTIASSILEEDEEMDLEEVFKDESLSPKLSPSPSIGNDEEDETTARHVFTDTKIKLTIKQLALKLSKRTKVKKAVVLKPLIDVVVTEIMADVVDRKWDTQGGVSMKEIAVMDYITPDHTGKPTYLLKTEGINDGNFLSARFVTITHLGLDFAAKYTGLQDTVSAQLSLVKINLNRESLAAILLYVLQVLPMMKSSQPKPLEEKEEVIKEDEEDDEVDLGSISSLHDELNPNDLTGGTRKKLDLHLDVNFDGIDISLLQKGEEFVHTGVTGFLINGRVQTKEISLEASIHDMSVMDTSSSAEIPSIISKAEKEKKFIFFKLTQYSHPPHERDPNDMSWVDTALEAEITRINVNLDTSFLVNVVEFAVNLNISKELFQSAAVATAEKATVTANAIVESAKTAHRVKLDILIHAPTILLPYNSETQKGGIYVDLGDFRLSNRFVHAHELESNAVESMTIRSGVTVMDCIELETTSIQVYRRYHSSICSPENQKDSQNIIMEPIRFLANIRRNISHPSKAYPNVDILLNIEAIKFHLHEDDIQAVISIVKTVVRIASVLPAPPPEDPSKKLRAQTLLQAKKKSNSIARPRSTTATNRWQRAVRLRRLMTQDGVEITDVRVSLSLQSITVDFATITAPLFKFTISDLNSMVNVFKSKVDVSGSVDSLSLIDLGRGVKHSKVVSLAEHSNKVSSLELTIFLDKSHGPLAPLGFIKTNIAQIQLVVLTPFVMQIVKCVQRLNFDRSKMLDHASKVAQDGAHAVSAVANDKYFKVDITVHAPVLILPFSEDSDQAFMVDLGSLDIKNTLLMPDQSQLHVGIDAYGIKLESFKASRILMDSSKPGCLVVTERILLQPFCMLLAVERNLCGWYKKIPLLRVNLNLGDLSIFVGQEDLEKAYKFGMALADEIMSVLPNKPASVTAKEEEKQPEVLPDKQETKEEDIFEKFHMTSKLPQFEIKLFKNEPCLSKDSDMSKDLTKCDKFALADLQLVTIDLKVQVSSNGRVELQASMKDVSLCNSQEEASKRNTGNRVIQHYTSNPLKAFTGKMEKPLISINYILREDSEHNIIASAQDLLVLSDVEFISTVVDSLKAIVQPSSSSHRSPGLEAEESCLEDTLKITESSAKESLSVASETKEIVKKQEIPQKQSLLRLKCHVTISNFRVAIIEDIYSEQPQALTLRLMSGHAHVQLTEDHKHASASVSDLGIATSSFFDLDDTTSWVLLPVCMQVSMTGPPHLPAMDINSSIGPVSLTLSPAVVRLIIHAITTLIPQKETVVKEAPQDLWKKQVISSKYWFLEPVFLHKALPSAPPVTKGEVLTLDIESVEIFLENEGTSSSAAHPVLAINSTASFEVTEWTGQLAVSGDIHVEATYFNQTHSLWEPVLETLVQSDGRQILWDMKVKVNKAPPNDLTMSIEDLGSRPDFSVELSSISPLQLTLTKTSMQLIKNLVEAYTKEYGKQVEGSVKIQAITGSPYTVINKLGANTSLFVQPGPTLKIANKESFSKLSNDEKVDLLCVKITKKRSYASLIARKQGDEATVDLAVGNRFMPLKNVCVDNPGLYYYTLIPKESNRDVNIKTHGLVVDVAVTGTKKTATVRSPIQFKNHLRHNLDIVSHDPDDDDDAKLLVALKPEETYFVPIDVAKTHTFTVRPTGFGLTPIKSRILWQQRKDGQNMDLKCVFSEDESLRFLSRLVYQEEKYKMKRNVKKGEDYPHHIYNIYPPLILQNLLPFQIFVEAMDVGLPAHSLEPGQSLPIHELDLGMSPEVRISIIQKKSVGLKGKFVLEKQPPTYKSFPVVGSVTTHLTLHSEFIGYLKVGIFCPFWMINKTGLMLEYKDGNKVTEHPHDRDIVLLSTSNKKNKIQIRAKTPNGSYTDWTKSFAINAVGTSGNFPAKLGENTFMFGVETSLCQFTVSKMVMITPYYLLVNKTEGLLKVHELYNAGYMTTIPPGEVVPFWTLTNTDKMILVAGEGKKSSSPPFNFKKSDNTVLQFHDSNEVLAVCMEVQVSAAATVITFSSYYHGCVPLLVINHFSDLSLQFGQSTKDSTIIHTLSARESMFYTWECPLGRKCIRWNYPAATVHNKKVIDVTKDSQGKFTMSFDNLPAPTGDVSASIAQRLNNGAEWLEVDESFSEQLVTAEEESVDGDEMSISSSLSSVTNSTTTSMDSGSCRVYYKTFLDDIQRVLIFTPDMNVLSKIQSANSFSVPLFEASLSLKAIGLSLVDNNRKRELTYITVSPSGVIWQLNKERKKKRKRIWKTLNNSVIAILEDAYQGKKMDVKVKNLAVNLETMEMYSPLKGKLRRTHHEGFNLKFTMAEKDYALQAKIGHLQVDNQLPFSVYPQVLYPLPNPPSIASTTEPKPFVEASIILKKRDKSNVVHFKYVHVLVQKISLNVDLGFILSLVNFFSLREQDPLIEEEYVKSDVEYANKSLMHTVVPELADDISTTRLFFDVFHLAPIKINLSFNIRSVAMNKESSEISVGDRFLHLFLDSIGVILTSVQDIEMKFSLFHLEYQSQTVKGLKHLFVKHYRNQALFELHTLIFGLDVIGNPEAVVRGVVIGAKDLFYEPFKGIVLGPEEFLEGLGIGLKSFFCAGVVGGITGAGARITGAFGDVFAKLSFDDEFIEQRQQTKAKPPKLGWKLGGFAKNVFEGVTGVVTQPVKGLQKEGAVGLLKGTGKGLVGLLVRPAGGLVDLASGTLDFVTRKTKIGNFEITDVRPPRFIGRDGVIHPYSLEKAVGAALLVSVDEGNFVDNEYYVGHVQVQQKPVHFLLVTDRRVLLIERKILIEGWKSFQEVKFDRFESPVEIKDVNIFIKYSKEYKDEHFRAITFRTEDITLKVGRLINQGYIDFYLKEQ